METLAEADGILRAWAEVAEKAWQEDRDIAAALDEHFGQELTGVDPVHREKLETLNGIHSNAAGFRRWLDTRNDGHGHGHTSPALNEARLRPGRNPLPARSASPSTSRTSTASP